MSQSPFNKSSIDNAPSNKPCGNQNTDEGSFGPPVMDMDHYLSRVKELALTHEDQQELLGVFWNLLVIVADLELGIDPVQMLFDEQTDNPPARETSMVNYSSNQTKDRFAIAAVPNRKTSTTSEET